MCKSVRFTNSLQLLKPKMMIFGVTWFLRKPHLTIISPNIPKRQQIVKKLHNFFGCNAQEIPSNFVTYKCIFAPKFTHLPPAGQKRPPFKTPAFCTPFRRNTYKKSPHFRADFCIFKITSWEPEARCRPCRDAELRGW